MPNHFDDLSLSLSIYLSRTRARTLFQNTNLTKLSMNLNQTTAWLVRIFLLITCDSDSFSWLFFISFCCEINFFFCFYFSWTFKKIISHMKDTHKIKNRSKVTQQQQRGRSACTVSEYLTHVWLDRNRKMFIRQLSVTFF